MTANTRTTTRHLLGRALAAAVVLSVSLTVSGCGSTSSKPSAVVTSVDGIQRLDTDAFASLVSTPGVIVLDVRTPGEFATGHLANAVNVDFNGSDFASQIQALDPAKTYAIYCRSGNRSGQALEVMKSAGFSHVADLEGGINDWTQAGQDVVTS